MLPKQLAIALRIFLVLVAALTVADRAHAQALNTVNVQPIQICNDLGVDCAGVATFTDHTNKIFAQSGTTINFLPLRQLNSSTYLDLTTAERTALIRSTVGTERNLLAYDMWFAKSVEGAWGAGALGGDGLVISDDIIAANRYDTIAHELGHNFGYNHTADNIIDAPRYLMAGGAIRQIPTSLADIAPDGLDLDRFNPILPDISVDTIGSTPFQSTSFFHVVYNTGAATDVSLKKLTVNLAPAGAFTDPTNSPPGNSGSGFGVSGLNGIGAADIVPSGISDGSQEFSLTLAAGSFIPGDSFSFGVDIDLLSDIDALGATPDQLRTAVITFEFSNDYTVATALDDLVAGSGFDPTANYDKPALVIADPDPIPEPASLLLLCLGLQLVIATRARRSARI